MRTSFLAFFLISISCTTIHASCPVDVSNVQSEAAKQLAIATLGQFLTCKTSDPANDNTPCNTFVARGVESLYNVKDFVAPTGYLSANQIADFVAKSDEWSSVGSVFDEDNNLCAQSLANRAYPVIAVQKKAGHGHVALIIPGEPKESNTWKFKAANSAAFSLRDPADPEQPGDAYVNGPLSKTFGVNNAKTATFYYRKQDFKIDQK